MKICSLFSTELTPNFLHKGTDLMCLPVISLTNAFIKEVPIKYALVAITDNHYNYSYSPYLSVLPPLPVSDDDD